MLAQTREIETFKDLLIYKLMHPIRSRAGNLLLAEVVSTSQCPAFSNYIFFHLLMIHNDEKRNTQKYNLKQHFLYMSSILRKLLQEQSPAKKIYGIVFLGFTEVDSS